MHCDEVAEDLGENPLGLQPPIQCLVMHPHPPLQCPIFCWIHVVPGAFYFVGVAAVALVSLDPLARLKEVPQNLIENFNVGILTSRVWPPNSNQAPRKDVDTQLVAKGRLSVYLWDAKAFPFFAIPLFAGFGIWFHQ